MYFMVKSFKFYVFFNISFIFLYFLLFYSKTAVWPVSYADIMFVANACGKDATVKVPRTLSGTLRIPDPRQALCGGNKTVRNKTTNRNNLRGRGRQVGERECQRPSTGLTVCLPCPQPAHAGPPSPPPTPRHRRFLAGPSTAGPECTLCVVGARGLFSWTAGP